MSTPTVRVSETTRRVLKEIAQETGQTMTETLEKAVDAYRRKVFFEQLNAGYAEWRADAKAWADMEHERQLLNNTLRDGLDADEHWTEDGRCLAPEENES